MESKNIRGVIYVEAREWRDKVNGNSYFSGRIFLNGEQVAVMPFQYGYGSMFEHEAVSVLQQLGYLPISDTVSTSPLWRFKELGFVTHSVKYSATKADTKRFGEVA